MVCKCLTRPAPIGIGWADQTQLAALTRLASEEDEQTRPNWLSLSPGSFLHTALAWSLLAAYRNISLPFSSLSQDGKLVAESGQRFLQISQLYPEMFGLWWDGTLYSEMVHCSAMSGFFTFTSLRCSAFDEMSELSFSFDSALSRSGSPSDGASTLSLLSSPFDGGLCPSMKHCPRSSFDSRWSSTAVHCFFPQVGGCSSFKWLSIQTLSPSSFFIENFLW